MKDATTAAKVPVYDGETIKFYALLDPADHKRLSQYQWFWDDNNKLAFRNVQAHGKTHRSHLHREVMGLKKGDGKVLLFKSDDRLDCRRNNLEYGPSRDLSAHHPDKWFPRKKDNFVSYIQKNHPKSAIANLLEQADLVTYNMREIQFTVEDYSDDDAKKASTISLQSELRTFMQNEFGYKGKVAVVRIKTKKPEIADKPLPKPAAAVKPVIEKFAEATKPVEPKQPEPQPAPLPPAAAALVNMPMPPAMQPIPPQPMPESMSFLAKLKTSLGLTPNSSFEFVNFGVREGDDIHIFQYNKKKVSDLNPPANAVNG